MNPLIQEITIKKQLRDDIPDFRAGDNVRVHAKIVEGERERIQVVRRRCYQASRCWHFSYLHRP